MTALEKFERTLTECGVRFKKQNLEWAGEPYETCLAIDPDHNTYGSSTGIYFNPDGSFKHVETN